MCKGLGHACTEAEPKMRSVSHKYWRATHTRQDERPAFATKRFEMLSACFNRITGMSWVKGAIIIHLLIYLPILLHNANHTSRCPAIIITSLSEYRKQWTVKQWVFWIRLTPFHGWSYVFHSQVDILDTSGDMQFPAMRRLSIATAHAFLLVYATTSAPSFASVKQCFDEIREQRADFQVGVILSTHTH